MNGDVGSCFTLQLCELCAKLPKTPRCTMCALCLTSIGMELHFKRRPMPSSRKAKAKRITL